MQQPALPAYPRRAGFPCFSEEEIERHWEAMRGLMRRQGLDAIVAYGAGRFNQEMLWLSGWPGGREGFVLLPAAGEPMLLVQFFNHVPLAQRLSMIRDTRWAGVDAMKTVAERIEEIAAERDGAEPPRIGLVGPWRATDRDRLAAALDRRESAALVDLTRAYRALRSIRSEEELAFFRVAAELTDQSMEALEAGIEPGMPEHRLAELIEQPYLHEGGYAGIHYLASTPMNAPRAFVPHQYLSNRPLANGDTVISEVSGSFWGYASQIHRTFTIGCDPTPEYARLHDAAVETFEAVLGVLRDGATGADVLDAADILHRRGYTIVDDLLHGADQYPPILRTRHTDHGNDESFVFRENMVVTVQPHLVTPDLRIGLQFGETVRITRDGVETLHRYPRTMIRVA
ncbi:MAG: M24 family metallopeptidase [Chloroflexota bacterium]